MRSFFFFFLIYIYIFFFWGGALFRLITPLARVIIIIFFFFCLNNTLSYDQSYKRCSLSRSLKKSLTCQLCPSRKKMKWHLCKQYQLFVESFNKNNETKLRQCMYNSHWVNQHIDEVCFTILSYAVHYIAGEKWSCIAFIGECILLKWMNCLCVRPCWKLV